MLRELILSIRPVQWYKNSVMFVGIVFSFGLPDLQMWLHVILAFAIFCMLSGSGYIINDILDIQKDREHPRKSERPIASGKLRIVHALLFAIALILIAVITAYLVNIQLLVISIAYLVLMLIYSVFLKQLIIVDVLAISTGFVIRAVAGCLAIDAFISPWLIICAFLLALFLALGKRRHELLLLGAGNSHSSFQSYSTEMLDQMINITTGALIMSYSLYTFLADNTLMMLTVPFVIYGLFRYLFLIHARNIGGEPEVLFKDKGILSSMILWGVAVVSILYGVLDPVINFFVRL